MTRVLVITPNSLDPMHPRHKMVHSVLTGAGYDVELVEAEVHLASGWSRTIHRLCLGAFDLESPWRHWRDIRAADVVFVCDMRLLFVLLLAKLVGKRTVYETLDNCPHLFHYGLCRAKPFFRSLPVIRWLLSCTERIAIRLFADETIVNSDALNEWFSGRADTLYYTSPLEGSAAEYQSQAPPAFLYLGLFSEDKGADDMLALQKEHQVPLYVFGDITPEAEAEIQGRDVFIQRRINPSELEVRVRELAAKHALIGLSLIRPVHYSYATQEANKDIDYMALGFPIIGNHRLPTAQKINAGCGVFLDDQEQVRLVLNSETRRAEISAQAQRHYSGRYAKSQFAAGLLELLRRVSGGPGSLPSENPTQAAVTEPVLAAVPSTMVPDRDGEAVKETP